MDVSQSAQASLDRASGKAVASLVFGILAITGALPCIGSVLAIALGAGEESGVGRAGVLIGLVSLLLPVLGLGFMCCFGVPFGFFAGIF